MIQVKSLYKSFEGKDVLVDINATFNNGKTNLIIGQSGSGKTVLMKCIVGLLTPEKGEILYDGRNFLNMNKKEKKTLRREMGMIFQSAALFDSLTVLENVMFPLDMFSNDTYRDRVKRAQFCLDRVNLMEAQNKYPGEISGGMQKRVAIARAIALNPQYLFCDEPNSGLDPKTSLVIDELIHDITTEYNMTTIINTHDMNSVMGIGDSILYIYQGHKEWEGTKDDVFTATNERLNNCLLYTSNENLWSKTLFLESFSNHLLRLTKLLFKHFVEFFHRNRFVVQSSLSFQCGRKFAFSSTVYQTFYRFLLLQHFFCIVL